MIASFDLNPYSFIAVPLFIISLAIAYYTLRIRKKTTAIKWITASLVNIPLGMTSMFLNAVVPQGIALLPMTDAFAIFSMAAAIEFGYRYPTRLRSLEARLGDIFALGVCLPAFGYSLYFAVRALSTQNYTLPVTPVYWFLNPLAFLAALVVLVRRMGAVQSTAGGRFWSALWRPKNRQVRVLRFFSLSLVAGSIQGVASALSAAGVIHPPLDAYGIGISMLLMLIAIIYAVFELAPQQPSLVARLMGLSLITLLAVLGAVGIYDIQATTERVVAQQMSTISDARRAARMGDYSMLPATLAYFVSWDENGEGTLLYAGDRAFDLPRLADERRLQLSGALPLPANWGGYYIEEVLHRESRNQPVQLRYGSHPLGSYHQYAGFTFNEAGQEYEVGFSLFAMSAEVRRNGQPMLNAVILGSILTLIAFPLFLHTNLVVPLNRLLEGVRRANEGNLSMAVPLGRRDEIGFLTEAFNKMTASLQESEQALRKLNIALERRVTERTRELKALYEVTEIASREEAIETMLSAVAEKLVTILHSEICAIYLLEERLEGEQGYYIHRAACWSAREECALPELVEANPEGKIERVLQQGESVLIPDLSQEASLPDTLRALGNMSLLLSPLRVDQRVLGVIGLFQSTSPTVEEVALLSTIADQVGVAMHRHHLRKQAARTALLEERQRVARDLHDSIAQSLYGLVTLTEAGTAQAEKHSWEDTHATLTRIGATARQAIKEMRLFIHQSQPLLLEENGLIGALHQRLAAVEGRSDVNARLLADEIDLSMEVQEALYYIAQEALNNALRHAQARQVTVYLRNSGSAVTLEIHDDGRGFDPTGVDTGGMGMKNMRSRAQEIGGALVLQSKPGEGTRLIVTVPQERDSDD